MNEVQLSTLEKLNEIDRGVIKLTHQRDALLEAAELAETTIERLAGFGPISSGQGTLDVLRAAIADAKK